MSGNNEKCISPWFGFLFIVVICVMIAAAIFFESKGARGHGRARFKTAPKSVATQVAFPGSLGGSDAGADKLVF